MQKVLTFSAEECIGCRYCVIGCVLSHKGVVSPSGSRLRLLVKEREMVHTAFYCRHCKNPVCMKLCPVGAIEKDSHSGLVKVNPEKCIGCRLCLDCPLGGMMMDEEVGLAINCDLCSGDPVCVAFCSSGALRYAAPERSWRGGKR